jgi:pimeloyl-ACP methyl ester carboxylesterase
MAHSTLFCLHALGSSARSFDAVARELADTVDVHAIDLPGFGSAADRGASSVEQKADYVEAMIRASKAERWFLAGHSMGGKIASIVAARGLDGLAGVVLLAASPPGPEPMSEERRERMLSWVEGSGHLDEAAAREFIGANVGAQLPKMVDARVVEDLLRTSGAAWVEWLREGSREDWSAKVGTLEVPAVILAGGADGDLGPQAQLELHGPVYPQARFVTLPEAGHLLPLERPRGVAEQVRALLA